jgi:thiosulfate/3-mercaptopyruvate sulfurtransferase
MPAPIGRGVKRLVALLVLVALPRFEVAGPRAEADPVSPRSVPALADSTAPGQLIQPEDLARLLADSTARQPVVLQVGFKVLFRSGHIPGSRYIGPASKPEGLTALKQALQKIPRGQAIVLYCGCCPWADCPNVRPALRVARRLRSGNVRALYVAKSLQHDWVEKGLPISQGDQ